MARLVAEARGLYYRTQDPLAEPLAALLELPSAGVVNVLDPCAGAGIFLTRLLERMAWYAEQRECSATLVSYGVEPNRERAQIARRIFTQFLQADFFHIRVSKGRFQLAILNPPYDADVTTVQTDEGGLQQRLEMRFLRRTTHLLAPDAVLVLIIPQAQLVPAARHLAGNYHNFRCWRYPDLPWAPPADEETDADGKPKPPTPLYQQFRQVVVFATRRRTQAAPAEAVVKQVQGWAYAGADLPAIPLDSRWLAEMSRWQVPADGPPSQHEREHGASRTAAGGRSPATDETTPLAGHAMDEMFQASGTSGVDEDEKEVTVEPPEHGELLDTVAVTGAQNDRAVAEVAGLDPIEFSDPTIELERLAVRLDEMGGGVWSDSDYRAQRWPDLARLRLGMDRPLGPLRLGHLITLAAVGLLNGRILHGPGGRCLLVKGACRKEIVVEEEIDRSPGGRETLTKTETERFAIALWAIDLATGELIHIV